MSAVLIVRARARSTTGTSEIFVARISTRQRISNYSGDYRVTSSRRWSDSGTIVTRVLDGRTIEWHRLGFPGFSRGR